MPSAISSGQESALPAPATIALALAVVKTKPAHLEIEDYIDCINKHTHSEDDQTTFDVCAFWKEQCRHVLARNTQLEDEVTRLQARLDELKHAEYQPSRKRKTDVQTVFKANTQSKRRKVDPPPVDDSSEEDIDAHKPSDPDIKRLFRSALTLLRLSNQDDSQRLLQAILSFCTNLSQLVDKSQTLADTIPKICTYLNGAISRLAEVDTDQQHFRQAIARISSLYQQVLSKFHQTALDEITRREEDARNSRTSKSKRHRSNTKVTKSTSTEDEQEARSNMTALTKTMATMITSLGQPLTAHTALFEALMSVLLDHIGSTLSLLVFTDTGYEGEGILPPAGITDTAHIDRESASATAKLAGPYLINILRTAIQTIHKQHHTSKHRPNKNDRKIPLHWVEERLQNTLLRGVFGDDTETIANAFRRADEVDEQQLQQDIEDASQEVDSEWFIGELWELVGWDVLPGRPAIME